MSLAAPAARGRPSASFQGRSASRGTTALVPRRGRRKAAPGLRHGPQGAASSGPARRLSPSTRLAASAVVHFSAFLVVVAFGAVAAREPVARLVQAAAKPPRQLMACHGACCQGAPPRARTPRATPDHDGPHRGRPARDRRGKRLKEESSSSFGVVPRRLVDAETEWAPRYQRRRAPARRWSRSAWSARLAEPIP